MHRRLSLAGSQMFLTKNRYERNWKLTSAKAKEKPLVMQGDHQCQACVLHNPSSLLMQPPCWCCYTLSCLYASPLNVPPVSLCLPTASLSFPSIAPGHSFLFSSLVTEQFSFFINCITLEVFKQSEQISTCSFLYF